MLERRCYHVGCFCFDIVTGVDEFIMVGAVVPKLFGI